MFRSVTGCSHPFHADAERALQGLQFGSLLSREKGRGDPRASGAPGPTHSMDEVFSELWQFVINYVRDVLDMNAARRNIGCNEDSVPSFLKPGQRGSAL